MGLLLKVFFILFSKSQLSLSKSLELDSHFFSYLNSVNTMAAYGDRRLTVGLGVTCRQTVSACAGDGCRRIRKRRVPRFGFVTCRVLETTCAGWVCDVPRFGCRGGSDWVWQWLLVLSRHVFGVCVKKQTVGKGAPSAPLTSGSLKKRGYFF